MVEILDPYNLETLQPQMERLGYHFQYTPQTPTTMRLAEAHVRAGGQIPAVFLTDHQIEGRGREGRVWHDKEGASILVTAVLGIKDSTIPTFADLVALHTASILRSVPLIDDVCIKYPNDLVIGDKKMGGMLVVNNYENQQYLGTSVGLGVNVHYSGEELSEYPTDYGATALDLHTAPKINSREAILVAFLEKLGYLAVDAEVFTTNLQTQQDLNNLWRAHSAVVGKMVQVEADNEVFIRGRVVDTQIGRGISLGDKKWFNQFDAKMKVRVLE